MYLFIRKKLSSNVRRIYFFQRWQLAIFTRNRDSQKKKNKKQNKKKHFYSSKLNIIFNQRKNQILRNIIFDMTNQQIQKFLMKYVDIAAKVGCKMFIDTQKKHTIKCLCQNPSLQYPEFDTTTLI